VARNPIERTFTVERDEDGRIIIVWPSGHATGPWTEDELRTIYDADEVAEILRMLSDSDEQ
jgi:hypothetical protein